MIIKELFFFLASYTKKTAVVGTKVFGENCCGFPLQWWLQNNCPALCQSSASFEFIGSNSLSQETEKLLWKPGFMIRHNRVIRRSQWGVKCKLKRNSGFSELTYMLPQERHFCLLCTKSRALRQDGSPFEDLSLWTSFVLVETSRLYFAWSTDERNLTDILVMKTNLSHFCLKCDPYLFQGKSMCKVFVMDISFHSYWN